MRHVVCYYVTLLLNRELVGLIRAKLCLVTVSPDIVKDCPKIRNLPEIFLRSFENVVPVHIGYRYNCHVALYWLLYVGIYVPDRSVVDGGWCEWSDWSECYSEVTSKKRSRRCECPPPINSGKNCPGMRSCEVKPLYL